MYFSWKLEKDIFINTKVWHASCKKLYLEGLLSLCGALRDLVAFEQFKKPEKHPWRSVPATLLKLALLHGCFSRFLNSTNGSKLRNASHLLYLVNTLMFNVPKCDHFGTLCNKESKI